LKMINERSMVWLLLKGAGGAITIAIAILIAVFAYLSFDLSNSARLNEVLNETRSQLDQYKYRADSLQLIVSNYNAKRFTIHTDETRILFNEIYLKLYRGRNRYSVSKFDSLIVRENNLPTSKPHVFDINGQQYYIIAERLFREKNDVLVDSVLFYCDSLKAKNSSSGSDSAAGGKKPDK